MRVCLQFDLGILHRMNLSIRQAVGENPAVRFHIGLNKNIIPVNKPGLYD